MRAFALLLIAGAVSFDSVGFSTLAQGEQGESAWKEIVGEVALSSDAYSVARHLCDRIGHRLAGSDNGRRAEEYVHAKLTQYGLSNVGYEPFEFLAWARGDLTVEVTAPASRKLQAYALGNTPSGAVDAELVDIGFGTPGEFEKMDDRVKGRIALVRHGAPEGHRDVHRSEKMTLTHTHGGAAMVLINSVAGGVVQVGTCSIGKISAVPGIAVNREIGEWMTRLLKEGPVRMKISAAATSGPAIARNVVGEIVGETEEVVMIGGHLDSWDLAQGAIDNGAGVAVVLETARALGSLKRQPRRTLRFVLFMGEELGLYGSRAYVKAHEKELDRIVMMMNLDMCGKPSGYALGPCEEALDFFRVLSSKLERLGLGAAPTAKAGLHSDHQPFMMAGVPTMTLQSKLDDEQGKHFHSAGDTFDLVKEEYLNEAAVASAIALWALATAPDRPAPRLTSDQVRERCIRDGVKQALELMDDWPFED